MLKKQGVRLRKSNFFLLYRKNHLPYCRFAWAFYVRGKAKSFRRNKLKRWAREFMKQKILNWSVGLDILCGMTNNQVANNYLQEHIKYEEFYSYFEKLCQQIKV